MTDPNLNPRPWRRGFFRLWLVLSAAWLISVTALFYEGISDPYIAHQGIYYTTDSPDPVVIDQYSDVYRDMERGKSLGQIKSIAIDGLPMLTLFVSSDLPDEKIAQQVDDLALFAPKMVEKMKAEKRREATFNATLAGLSVPFFLLVCGTAIGWVISGFTSKKAAA